LVTFAVSWWLFFFMALPFGVRQQEEPVPGSDPGAPQKPRLLIKALVATVMAALATWGLAVFIDSGLVDLRAR
jgi:predicted secreted protein